MKKNYRLQDHVAEGKEIFVGLEDSKRTWKLAVRSEKMLIHQVSMDAKYPVLIGYLRNEFPRCTIHLMYEAGFKGFNLYDQLTEDGIDCVVIPPHVVTEPKVNRIKTDKRDARRLAKVLENHDYQDSCFVPDKERRVVHRDQVRPRIGGGSLPVHPWKEDRELRRAYLQRRLNRRDRAQGAHNGHGFRVHPLDPRRELLDIHSQGSGTSLQVHAGMACERQQEEGDHCRGTDADRTV